MVSHITIGKREAIGYRGIERRGMLRQQSPVRARIILSSGQIVRCSVKGFSKNGAMISVQSILGLPELFELDLDGKTSRVKVMRREPTRLALKFL